MWWLARYSAWPGDVMRLAWGACSVMLFLPSKAAPSRASDLRWHDRISTEVFIVPVASQTGFGFRLSVSCSPELVGCHERCILCHRSQLFANIINKFGINFVGDVLNVNRSSRSKSRPNSSDGII